jgi:hypothetical protein
MDVGLRCHDVSWAILRLGMTGKKSVLRSATVERADVFKIFRGKWGYLAFGSFGSIDF